jgi:hypothetical protein
MRLRSSLTRGLYLISGVFRTCTTKSKGWPADACSTRTEPRQSSQPPNNPGSIVKHAITPGMQTFASLSEHLPETSGFPPGPPAL